MRRLKLSEILLAVLLLVSIAFNLKSYILEQTRHEAKEISALQSVSAAQAGTKSSRLLELPVASPSPGLTHHVL